MSVYKKSVSAFFLVMLILILLLSGCGIETPQNENGSGSDDPDTTTAPIETEILGTWRIAAILVHGHSRQQYIGEIYLIFKSDGTVELSDNNYEEPFVYTGTYYAEDDKVYTDYTSVNQEHYEVSPENMNGVITIDASMGELVYDYVNDSNGLTWYFSFHK